ncbi:hypothetical protein F5X68DRAFT_244988 [Plectosphaerella plurivora]|uniref:NmrA-like domain-containing protein n=1 Tax=Plectosphaerella plurivora TaxID=936078 RepID=A0A9P8V6N2_9PEZI|nr:hypothetical protein F5X68DRAFT_244988 [Plectosphaerella plurivora]
MVKIAIAGASGNVAQELLEVLVSSNKHEILLLSRKSLAMSPDKSAVTSVQVDYEDTEHLVHTLRGVHTLLCFITPQSDPGNTSQKNLIDAAVKAGVVRYAPSEWATSSVVHMPWYARKAEIREYLKELNRDSQVIEYCLFQVGVFVNYFASPYKTTKHIHPFQNHFDFNNRRAIVLEGAEDATLSLITAHDFCAVVAEALDYPGTWPVVGGIVGERVTARQLLAIGEKIRGPFSIEAVQRDDLEAGVVKTTWLPKADHPAIPSEQVEKLSGFMVAGMLLGMAAGALDVSSEWNDLLPNYKFTRVEDFLTAAWHGKP